MSSGPVDTLLQKIALLITTNLEPWINSFKDIAFKMSPAVAFRRAAQFFWDLCWAPPTPCVGEICNITGPKVGGTCYYQSALYEVAWSKQWNLISCASLHEAISILNFLPCKGRHVEGPITAPITNFVTCSRRCRSISCTAVGWQEFPKHFSDFRRILKRPNLSKYIDV